MMPGTIADRSSWEAPGRFPVEHREARLRPEYAFIYPTLKPGVWESAATLADRLLADCLLRGRDSALRGRLLLDAHFEFRGGCSRGGERMGVRSGREATP
ncbi:MAG TPA: hypothetical protein VJ808_06790 [Gemmatimonadales bacterium]|nr:hypothetical protein [Gemmatimonadales bacterium]